MSDGSRVRKIQSENQFDRILNASNSPKKLVVVDWNADWCGPCKQISPVFHALSEEYPRAVFLSVNCDECKELAQSKGVKALPTFMFYKGSEKFIDETLQGADATKLKEKIARLNSQIDPFTGQGHSLSGSSAAEPSAAAAASSAASSSSAQSAPPRRRVNPWADPSFVPPGVRAQEEAKKKAAEEAKRKQQEEAARKNKPASPWADPSFQPQPMDTSSSPESANETDPELAEALKMSMMDTDEPAAAADTTAASSSSSSTSAKEGNDPQLLKNLNQNLLTQLLGMGFSQIRAEKALILTKNQSIDRAMDWLLQHESDADIDEPLKVIGSAPKEDPQKVWAPNERGAPLGWKPGVEYVDEEQEDPHASALMKRLAKKKKPSETVAGPTTPLTQEEKIEHLEKRREEMRREKLVEKQESAREREKKRQQSAKEVVEMKRLKEERETRLLVERKKREKQREKDAKKRIRDKIKADKQRRKREAAERAEAKKRAQGI